MATIIQTNQDLMDAVNAGGFATLDEFIKFMQRGRLQVAISRYQVANSVLDAQRASQNTEIEAQKSANNQQIASLQAQLAELT